MAAIQTLSLGQSQECGATTRNERVRAFHIRLQSFDFASRDALAGDPKVYSVTKAIKGRLRHVVGPLEAVPKFTVWICCKVEASLARLVTVIQVFLLGV